MAKQPKNEGAGAGSTLSIFAANAIADALLMTRQPGTDGLARDIRGLSTVHRASLVGLQAGIETLIDRSGLSSATQIIAEDVVDKVFRGIRALPPDATVSLRLQSLEDGVKNAISAVKAKFKSAPEAQAAKKSYGAICAELSQGQREEWFYFDRAVQRHGDPDDVELIERLKPLIPGKELIVEALGYPVGDRLEFLKSRLIVGQPGIIETIKDAAMRRETPWTRDAKDRVAKAKTKAMEIAAEQGAKATELDRANRVSRNEKIVRAMVALLILFVIIMILKGV